jgi:hypothetical protein
VNVSGVHVSETATGSEGSIQIRGSEDVTVQGGSVRRLTGSVAGPAVKVVGVSGTFPTRVKILGVEISTEIAGKAVEIESVQDLTFLGNTIIGSDATQSAVWVKATGRDIGGLVLSDNQLRGTYLFGVMLSGNPSNVVGASLTGNYFIGATSAGLRCENPAKFTKPVVHSGYFYDGVAAAASGCTGIVVGQSP